MQEDGLKSKREKVVSDVLGSIEQLGEETGGSRSALAFTCRFR